MVLLDTCVLLWQTLEPAKLSPAAAKACMLAANSNLLVSSISIWEIGIKIQKGKLNIGTSLEDFVVRLKGTGVIQILPVDETIWIENLRLPWDHADPADRTIVATASLRGIPIITPDAHVRAFYKNVIW